MTTILEISRKILASGIEINYLQGEFLFRKGQKAEFVFYLLEGSILMDAVDNQTGILQDKPVFLGLQEALESSKHIYNAQTKEPCKFLVFDKKFFTMLLQEFDTSQLFVNHQIKEFELFHPLLH
ncbi:cyclic nucleotide-binding domain-containing protein [Aquirufa sp. ROCK2-A2]